eukprot:Pgem_evm1s5281
MEKSAKLSWIVATLFYIFISAGFYSVTFICITKQTQPILFEERSVVSAERLLASSPESKYNNRATKEICSQNLMLDSFGATSYIVVQSISQGTNVYSPEMVETVIGFIGLIPLSHRFQVANITDQSEIANAVLTNIIIPIIAPKENDIINATNESTTNMITMQMTAELYQLFYVAYESHFDYYDKMYLILMEAQFPAVLEEKNCVELGKMTDQTVKEEDLHALL